MNIVYIVKNTLNGHYKIGSTNNAKHRWCCYLSELNRNQHTCKHLQSSFNKYGSEVFEFIVVAEYESREAAYQAEQQMLDKHFGKPYCYNENPKATQPPSRRGIKLSEVTKSKMRAAHTNIKRPDNIFRNKEKFSKYYSFMSPSGEIFQGKNLNEFCKKHSLHQSCMYFVSIGKRKSHKNWISW